MLLADEIDGMLHMTGGDAQSFVIDDEERLLQAGQCFFTSCWHRCSPKPQNLTGAKKRAATGHAISDRLADAIIDQLQHNHDRFEPENACFAIRCAPQVETDTDFLRNIAIRLPQQLAC